MPLFFFVFALFQTNLNNKDSFYENSIIFSLLRVFFFFNFVLSKLEFKLLLKDTKKKQIKILELHNSY